MAKRRLILNEDQIPDVGGVALDTNYMKSSLVAFPAIPDVTGGGKFAYSIADALPVGGFLNMPNGSIVVMESCFKLVVPKLDPYNIYSLVSISAELCGYNITLTPSSVGYIMTSTTFCHLKNTYMKISDTVATSSYELTLQRFGNAITPKITNNTTNDDGFIPNTNRNAEIEFGFDLDAGNRLKFYYHYVNVYYPS